MAKDITIIKATTGPHGKPWPVGATVTVSDELAAKLFEDGTAELQNSLTELLAKLLEKNPKLKQQTPAGKKKKKK